MQSNIDMRIRLLIVEDEAPIRNGISRHIRWQELGVDEIRCAANAEEALSMQQEFHPDIVLSDIRMPGMLGTDMCRKIHELSPDTRFIFISGYSDKEYLMAAIDLQAIGYVEKPIDGKELAELVRQAVQQIRFLRQAQERGISPTPKDHPLTGNPDAVTNPVIRQVCSYIFRHLSEPDLNVPRLAQEAQITPTYLSALFKKSTGINLTQYITLARMEAACELLRDPSLRLYEIAEAVGYTDSKYFSQQFRRTLQQSPKQYRENL